MTKNKVNSKKAFEYYCKGLNSKEIAKLLDCSYRTIQNFMSAENWKEKKKPNIKCKCKPDNTTGETSVMCCNNCGLPTEKFWTD